ncbi:34758_t:CDS:2, partial [Gigaspora margarita]
MDPKGTIEVLKEIKNKQREQTIKKTKKNHIEAVNLDDDWTTTNMRINVKTSTKASMNMKVEVPGWKESELKKLQQEIINSSIFDIDNPSSEEAFPISEQAQIEHTLARKPGWSEEKQGQA